MSRKYLTIYIAAALLFLSFLAILGYTVYTERQTGAELQKRTQLQESYNRVLIAKEQELGIPLREFTLAEEDQMIYGERSVEDVVADIVIECATPEPILSGKTQAEVIAEFQVLLEEAKKDFTLKIDALIAEAKVDYQTTVTDKEKEELILDYVERMAALEEECDGIFQGYMESLESSLIAVDGSLDSDDIAQTTAFQEEYDTEKATQMARFSKEYNQ